MNSELPKERVSALPTVTRQPGDMYTKKSPPYQDKQYFAVLYIQGLRVISEVPFRTASAAVLFGENEEKRLNKEYSETIVEAIKEIEAADGPEQSI